MVTATTIKEQDIQVEAAESNAARYRPAAMEVFELENLMGQAEVSPVSRDHTKITCANTGQVTTLYTGFSIDENGEFHFR